MQEIRRKRKAAGRPKAAPRNRLLPLQVYVNDRERELIERNARSAGLSVSSYLRAVGIGYRPPNIQDMEAFKRLADVNNALGMISQALTGRARPEDVVAQIKAAQTMLAEAAAAGGPQ